MKTITVKNSLGRDIEINKEDFVKRWVDTHGDVWNLVENIDDIETVERIVIMIQHLAEKKFDLLLSEKEQAS